MFDLLICWQPHSHCAHNLKTNLICIFVSLIHSSHHFFLYCASRRCSWLLRCAISRHIFRVQEINQFYLRKRGESFFFQCPGNRHCRRCRLNCSFLINTQSARRNTQKRLEIVCFWFDEYQFLYHIIWTLLCRMHAGFYSELFAVVLQQCGCESTEVACVMMMFLAISDASRRYAAARTGAGARPSARHCQHTHRFPLYIFVLLSPIHTRLLVRFIWCLCASALRFSPHSLSRCESFFFCFSFYSVRFMCSNARACSQMHVRLAYFYFREARANTWKNKTEYRI